VRTQALSSLRDVSAPLAIPIIKHALATDQDLPVQQRALQMLDAFGASRDTP